MKICISRIDKMGDLILTLPVIKSIKKHNPSAKIDIYVSNRNIKIIKNFKYVNKIFNVQEKQHFGDEKYDYFLNFSPGWRSFFLCLFSKSLKKANVIYTSRYNKKIYSKLLIKILSRIFFSQTLIVNRISKFHNNETIHQTEVMYELLNKCNIYIDKNTNLEKFLPKSKTLVAPKKICVIHLSSKWLNKYYSEKDFLNLVLSLENKYIVALTSDETTENKFNLIFDTFPIIDNKQFKLYNSINQTTIFKDLQFYNWVQTIYSANLVITPECGCSHIASVCKIHSKIIYDPENKPEMIHQEYHPWKSSYEKFIFNKNNLNSELIKNLY